ncbi:MAG: mechanosensitive ion channel domain-containing protein [Bacteroidota bacterium]
MNELFTPQLGPLILYAILSGLLGFFLYTAFRLAWRYGLPMIRRPRIKAWLLQWLPMVEVLMWVAFVLLSMGYLIAANFVPGLIFCLIMIGGFWPYLLNLMGGIMIRMGNRFRIGQRVRINQHRGLISRMGLMEMDLEIEDGQTVVIPYHQIPQSKVILEDSEEEIAGHTIELAIDASWSIAEAHTNILTEVMLLPWTSSGRLPIIEPIIHDSSQALYRVVLFSSHQRYFLQMEQRLLKHFASRKLEAVRRNGH